MKQSSKRKKANAPLTKGVLDARVNPDTCGQSNLIGIRCVRSMELNHKEKHPYT